MLRVVLGTLRMDYGHYVYSDRSYSHCSTYLGEKEALSKMRIYRKLTKFPNQNSKHTPAVASPSTSSTVPTQSSSSHADSPATFLLTSTTSSQKPTYTFTGTPPQPTTIVETITVTSFSKLTTSAKRTSVTTTPFVGSTKPATSATNLLPAPSHANLAISPRQAAPSTVSSAPSSSTSSLDGNMPAKEHRNQLARSTMIILVFALLILLLMLGLGGLAVRRYHRNGYVWKDWGWA